MRFLSLSLSVNTLYKILSHYWCSLFSLSRIQSNMSLLQYNCFDIFLLRRFQILVRLGHLKPLGFHHQSEGQNRRNERRTKVQAQRSIDWTESGRVNFQGLHEQRRSTYRKRAPTLRQQTGLSFHPLEPKCCKLPAQWSAHSSDRLQACRSTRTDRRQAASLG